MSVLVAAALWTALAAVQEEPFKLDPKKVDEAVQAAGKQLLGFSGAFGAFPYGRRHQAEAQQGYAELVLYTLVASGQQKEGDGALGPLLRQVLEREILSTYTASLGAMALQRLNPGAHQRRIQQYAQYLCDQQAQNGQWDYGAPEGPAPEPAEKKPPPKGAGPRRPPARKLKPGPPGGDHSNSQFAALGLRACLDAGIDVDAKVLQSARQAWVKTQNADGGWGYHDGKAPAEDANGPTSTSYGSMTAGGVSSLLVLDFYLAVNPKGDEALKRGLEWLGKNYDVIRNPKKQKYGSFYYLYALERVGSLTESDRVGNWEWYADGARHLMTSKRIGAGWHAGDVFPREAQADTCFAVLFLSRATEPLRKIEPPVAAKADAPPSKPLPKGPGGVVDIVAPGWRVMNLPKGAADRLLGDARGRSNVLVTAPPNLATHPTLRREVAFPAGGKPRLRAVVGHHETNRWTLLVKVDDREIRKVAVGAPASKDGWVEVDVDLSSWAGKEPLIELVAVPSGEGTDVAYWAEVALVER